MATFTKRESKGKTVWGAQIRRKGQPSISATFARLTDARRWAARQEAAISEARAVPGSAARRHTVAEVVDRYCTTVLPHKRPKTIMNQQKGFVNLLRLIPSLGTRGYYPVPLCHLGGPLRTRHRGPALESLPHLVTVLRRRQQMPPGSEVLADGAIGSQKPLGVAG